MITLFVRHKVTDYDEWRAIYDVFEGREAMGVSGQGVYRHLDDPNEVTVYHEFNTLEQAQAFLAHTEVQAAMMAGGVIGAPEVWLAERQ